MNNTALVHLFHYSAINIGFEQERYTVYEALNGTGSLSRIPFIKENGQESELTFEVIAALTLGSGPTAAQLVEDFFVDSAVQRSSLRTIPAK